MNSTVCRVVLPLFALLCAHTETWSGELGNSLWFTRVLHNASSGVDAIELYNPTLSTIDFSGFLLSSGETTEPIGIAGNVWSVLEPFEKRILRRGEPGSFNFSLGYDIVLYLYTPDLVRVEQIAWWRNDLANPRDSCMTRNPESAGSHDGHDWVTSGGDFANYTQGPVRYEPCPPAMLGPPLSAHPDGGIDGISIYPNPAKAGRWPIIAFALGSEEYRPDVVLVELYDLRGRRIRSVFSGSLPAGSHRIALSPTDTGKSTSVAGVYVVRLRVGSTELFRSFVLLP